MDILKVLGTAALSFAALYVIAELMGKKQVAQLEFVDYIVGISIGSIAAQMTVDTDIPFYHFLIAMGVFLLLDVIIGFLVRKSFFMQKILRGKPCILINDGKILYNNLKKSKIDINEMLSLCRNKNYFDINDIAYAVFETNGELSILPKSHASPLVSGDMNVKKNKPALSVDMIIDGTIIKQSLTQAGKNMNWLIEKLKEKSVKKINDIALVNYDQNTDDITVYYKN